MVKRIFMVVLMIGWLEPVMADENAAINAYLVEAMTNNLIEKIADKKLCVKGTPSISDVDLEKVAQQHRLSKAETSAFTGALNASFEEGCAYGEPPGKNRQRFLNRVMKSAFTAVNEAEKKARVKVEAEKKKKEQEACACMSIDSFEKGKLKTYTSSVLVTCHDKLYASRDNWKGTAIEPICAARYGAVAWQLDYKNNEKKKVINKVLSFKPNAFDFHLNVGYAFTTVNTLWTKGNPRISLGMYRTFSGSQHTEPMKAENYGWFNNYGMHLASQIKLTDTGEEQAVKTTAPGVTIGNERALEFESLLLAPAYMGKVYMYGKDRDYFFGLTALWAAKKIGKKTATQDNKYMFTSHYFGFRAAVGPDSYTDIMVGRAEGVAGTRLMIRGQMPFNIPNTDQVIFLGLEGNLAIKNRKTNPSPETIRGYMTWRFDDIFSTLKETKDD